MSKPRNAKSDESANSRGATRTAWTSVDVFPHADFPFSIQTANPQSPDALHVHKGFWELAVVYRGEGIHFTADDEYLIQTGDVFVIKDNLRHGFRDTRNLAQKIICFDPNRILIQTDHIRKLPGFHALFELEPKYRATNRFESRLQLSPEETAHMLSLIGMMETELEGALPGYEYTVLGMFMQMVSFLCRRYARSSHKDDSDIMLMANTISYIETHYAEQIGLQNLKDVANMSTSTLLRKFKRATEHTPVEYLLRVRVSHAVALLGNPEMSITEVAFAVGFQDSNYFARQFKRIMRVSPSEYRSLVGSFSR